MIFLSKVIGLWIALALCGDVASDPTFYFEVGGFSLETVIPNQMNETGDGLGILYMEHDRFIPGNILYIASNSLKTLDPVTMESWLIAGNTKIGYREGTGDQAMFNGPFSFCQLNASVVVVLDSLNHCFRTVNRETNSTSLLVGQCTIPGHIDGPFPDARFNMSERILSISQTEILVTDTPNKCIRKLDFLNEQVTTWIRINHTVIDMTFRPGHRDIYISFSGGFGKIDRDTKEVTFLTQTKYKGFRDGYFSTRAVLSGRPEMILFLDENVMLIADSKNKMLRIANFATQYVSSICNYPSNNATRPGEITVCRLGYTRSLLPLPEMGRVLIGQGGTRFGYMEIGGLSNSSQIHALPSRSNDSYTSTTFTQRNPATPQTTKASVPVPTPHSQQDHHQVATMTDVQLAPTVTASAQPSATVEAAVGYTVHHYHIPSDSSATLPTAGVVIAGIIVLGMMGLGFLIYRRRFPKGKSHSQASDEGREEPQSSNQVEVVREGPNMMRLKSLPRRPDANTENVYGEVAPPRGEGADGDRAARVGRYDRFYDESES